MRTWDYAQLSRMAKESGGVRELIRILKEAGRQQGRREMIPCVVAAAAAGAGITYVYGKICRTLHSKHHVSAQEIREAEESLVRTFEEYEKTECGSISNDEESDGCEGTGQ